MLNKIIAFHLKGITEKEYELLKNRLEKAALCSLPFDPQGAKNFKGKAIMELLFKKPAQYWSLYNWCRTKSKFNWLYKEMGFLLSATTIMLDKKNRFPIFIKLHNSFEEGPILTEHKVLLNDEWDGDTKGIIAKHNFLEMFKKGIPNRDLKDYSSYFKEAYGLPEKYIKRYNEKEYIAWLIKKVKYSLLKNLITRSWPDFFIKNDVVKKEARKPEDIQRKLFED